MTVAETAEAARSGAIRITMPSGLLGFETLRDYLLVSNPAEEPFLWLQVSDRPGLAFLLVSPFLVSPEYRPDISNEDAHQLDLKDPAEAMVLCIVTLRGSRATMNLKGPIVINRRTAAGKQVILNNAAEYSVQHPITVATEG